MTTCGLLVFTEHGVAMLSAVLRSERAVRISITIMQAFVKDETFYRYERGDLPAA